MHQGKERKDRVRSRIAETVGRVERSYSSSTNIRTGILQRLPPHVDRSVNLKTYLRERDRGLGEGVSWRCFCRCRVDGAMGKMAGAAWIVLISLSLFFCPTSAISADILESGPVILAGTNFTLHCMMNLTATTNGFTASDVIWYRRFNSNVEDHHIHGVLNDSVAILQIVNVQFGDRGHYFCALPGDNYLQYQSAGVTVHVGALPEPVQNLHCYTYNIDTYTCEWDDGPDTNLKNTDIMYYEGSSLLSESIPIKECVPLHEANECSVSHGYSTDIYVVTTNELGNATAKLDNKFDPNWEVRPLPPQNLVATATDVRKIRLDWDIPDTWNTAFGLKYWLQYRTENSEWMNVTHEALDSLLRTYTLTALEPYTEYFIRITAAYDVLVDRYSREDQLEWFGQFSDEISLLTLAEAPAAVIRNLVKLIDSDDEHNPDYRRQITIRWTEVPESEYRGPGFGYNITIMRDSDDEIVYYHQTTNNVHHITDSCPPNNLTISNLEKFVRYVLKVTPYNEAGTGYNPAELILHDDTTAPQPPVDVVAEVVSSTSIRIQWQEPSTITGYILGYQLQWWKTFSDTNMETREVNLDDLNSGLSYLISDLSPSTDYQIRVKTRNKRGTSSATSASAETQEATPMAPPQSVSVSSVQKHPDHLKVRWGPIPAPQRHGDITFYTIYYCPSAVQSRQETVTVSVTDSACKEGTLQTENIPIDDSQENSLQHTLEGLLPFTEYSVWMSGSTGSGAGPTSDVHRKRTSQGKPSVPLNLVEDFSNSSTIGLSWSPPDNINGILDRYEVYYMAGEEPVVVGTEDALLEVDGFTNYSIRVKACSGGHPEVACSDYSQALLVKTDIGAPMLVQDFDLAPNDHDTVALQWAPPLVPNGPIAYYVIRFWPKDQEELSEEQQTPEMQEDVNVDCSKVDGAADFVFTVYAVNEWHGVPLEGPLTEAKEFKMCNVYSMATHTIVLAILLPGLVVVIFFVGVLYVKQSDLFKPVPDPYFIEAVLDHSDDKFQMKGRLLNKRVENEKFDTLRSADSTTNLLLPPYDRLSSKESTSTSSSTDQGIHDMDGFPEEMRYVSEKTGSRNQSESEEEKPAPPSKHAMRIMSTDYEEDDDMVFGNGCDGSVTYSRIAEADGADGTDCSTPMLAKEQAQYQSDGSEAYAQLSQVPPQASATPPAAIRGLADQRSEEAFGSQSTVSYHRLGMTGLTPITSVETLPSEDPLTYSRMSQGSEPDMEYSQLAASSSNPTLTDPARPSAPSQTPVQTEGSTPGDEGKGVAMSLPSVSAGSRIQPQQEFIVATALAPGSHPNPVAPHDNAGYVTSPPPSKTAPAKKRPLSDVSKHDALDAKKLSDSKSQSGSDSSLTDGEGYSTLGLVDSPANSSPQPQATKGATAPAKSPAMSNGYVPNDIPTPGAAPPAPAPAALGVGANGYVDEADLAAISPPPKPSENANRSTSSGSPWMARSPNHIPNGLPKPGDNGYVTSDNLPNLVTPAKTVGQNPPNQIAANPYLTHEQMAQMPTASQSPPNTPPTPLNNNHPLPPGKKGRLDDPYIRVDSDVCRPQSSDFTVC